MHNRTIRNIVLLGALAIIGIISMQVYYMQLEWNNQHAKFSEKASTSLAKVASDIHKLNNTQPTTIDPVHKVAENYYIVDLNSNIDANILEYYLKNEFIKNNIYTDFEYAIYNCETNEMEYGNYCAMGSEKQSKKVTTNLPKYNKYEYYFGVRFPKQRTFFAQNMRLLFLISFIALIATAFFIYAIFIILRQKKLSDLQNDFIDSMTHEFKTPVTGIILSADEIAKEEIQKQPERFSTYIGFIKMEALRLNSQIDKLLQVAHLEKRNINLKKEKIDINSLITNVVENILKKDVKNSKISLQLDSSNPFVYADKVHSQNVIYNIIDNAVKYSSEQPEIEIKSNVNSNILKIVISDNGVGIPKEYQKNIFKKFYRINDSNKSVVNGSGLGLYYVKSICKTQKWKIRLDKKHTKGAAFVLEMKIEKR